MSIIEFAGKLIKSYESQTRPADPNSISDDNKSLYYYDNIDRLAKVMYPAGAASETKAPRGLVYSYDGKGRLDKISAILKTNNVSSEEILREYEYDQWNEIAEIKDHHKFASGSSEYISKSYDYDKFGRTKAIKYSLSTAPNDILESYSYDYDKNSNITKEKHTTGYQNVANVDETRNYEYDQLGRLISSDVLKADGTQVNNSYGYDKVGNRRLESSGGTSTWTSYNGLDQMVDKKNAGGGVIGTYSYDQNGNQITEVSGGTTKTSTYDAENRLTSVKEGSTVINSNVYRGDGQRIKKVEGSAVTNYTYLDGTVLYTSDSSGNRTSFNLYSADGGIISSKRYNGDNSGKYISYTKDVRGSTSTVLNDNGTYLISYSYSDFGETTRNGSSDVFNEIAYTGGIYDTSTELYYLNARYYDPADGVFLTQDTYRGENTDPSSLHLYAYCTGNPINFVDQSGHWAGKIHKEITKKAIKKTKLKKLKTKKLKKLLAGCILPDSFEGKYKNKVWHGHAVKTKQVEFWNDEKLKFSKTEKSLKKLGTYLHSKQDWNAHSYVDYSKGDLFENMTATKEQLKYHEDYTGNNPDSTTWHKKPTKKIHSAYKDNVNKDWKSGKWVNTKKKNNKRYKKAIKDSRKLIKKHY